MRRLRRSGKAERYHRACERRLVRPPIYDRYVTDRLLGTGFAAGGRAETTKAGTAFQG